MCWDMLAEILNDAPCSSIESEPQLDDLEFKRKRNRAYAQKSRMKKRKTLDAAKERVSSEEAELRAIMAHKKRAEAIQQNLRTDAIHVFGEGGKEKIADILETLQKATPERCIVNCNTDPFFSSYLLPNENGGKHGK
jgi:hypothetical protein